MGKVNYHLLADSVIINYEATTTPVRRGDVRFDPIVQAIKDGRLNDIPELLVVKDVYAKHGLKLIDGQLLLDGEELPESLSHRLVELIEADMPIQIMLNFWKNLRLNPSFNSRKMLYKFLEHNGHPLTEDGCFIAYRGVREDFKDVHSGKFDNSVGKTVSIDRSQVDDNPENTCSHGLHVACYDYARSFGPQLIEVKVNPKNVVAVPKDYNGTKMRVCEFEVMAECKGMLTGPVYENNLAVEEENDSDDYYSSDYYDSYNYSDDDSDDDQDDEIPF